MNKHLLWSGTLAYASFIFYLSHQEGGTGPVPMLPGMDKLLHVIEFFILTVLLFASLRATWLTWPTQKLARLAGWVSLGYAALDEWHQSFIVNRTASVYDWLADSVGIALALWLCVYVVRKQMQETRGSGEL